MSGELVCSGELGDVIYGEDAFDAVEEVYRMLSRLDEIGRHDDIDWKRLIGKRKYFQPARKMEFPPLHDVTDVQLLSGIDAEVSEPDYDDAPGMSFNQVDVRSRSGTVVRRRRPTGVGERVC